MVKVEKVLTWVWYGLSCSVCPVGQLVSILSYRLMLRADGSGHIAWMRLASAGDPREFQVCKRLACITIHLTVALARCEQLWKDDGRIVSSWGEVSWPAASSFLGGTPPALGSGTAHGLVFCEATRIRLLSA